MEMESQEKLNPAIYWVEKGVNISPTHIQQRD